MHQIIIDFNDDDENQQNVSDHDEIKQYLDTTYVCAPEACHGIFEFPMHNMSYAIYRLTVHLEREQNLYFIEGEEEARLSKNIDSTSIVQYHIMNIEQTKSSKTIETFELNKQITLKSITILTYSDFICEQ